jgi:hypothetical protein
MHYDVVGIAAAADQAENPVADAELGDSVAQGIDLASDFDTRNIGGRPRRGRILAEPLQDVRSIDGGRANANAHLTPRGLWSRDFANLENVRISRLTNHDRAHLDGSLLSSRTLC